MEETMEETAPTATASAGAPVDGPTGASATGAPAGAPASGTTGSLLPAERIAELEVALSAAEAAAAAQQDRYLRERAELDNYKKRLERTASEASRRERKELLLKLVGVIDNLERAIAYETSGASGGQEVEARNLLTGLRLTHSQFRDVLTGAGLTAMETVGQQFDPALHEAVASVPAADKPEGQIVGEVRKGYLYQGELLRPALVRVATNE